MRPWHVSALRALGAVAAVISACVVSGCSDGVGRPSGPGGPPAVLASTDVWGSVAQAVAGDDARVKSVISGTADPHSFEPSPATAAAIADSALVVYNGGGYDAWVPAVLGKHRAVPSVDAYSLLDAAAVGEAQPANEHVFYELNTVIATAERIAAQLGRNDSAHADEYRSRAAAFTAKAKGILETQHALRNQFQDAAVVATEPVAHYLLLAAGLTDKTPAAFTAAIEQDTDPAPAAVAAMLDLISQRQVAALLFNDQTVTGATKQIVQAAQAAGVPVVAVTETLPSGADYLTWQAETVDRLSAALRGGR